MQSFASLDYRTIVNSNGTVSQRSIGWQQSDSRASIKIPKSLKKLASRKNMLSILLRDKGNVNPQHSITRQVSIATG